MAGYGRLASYGRQAMATRQCTPCSCPDQEGSHGIDTVVQWSTLIVAYKTVDLLPGYSLLHAGQAAVAPRRHSMPRLPPAPQHAAAPRLHSMPRHSMPRLPAHNTPHLVVLLRESAQPDERSDVGLDAPVI